jgi:phosphoserine phosphatase RsbU/P
MPFQPLAATLAIGGIECFSAQQPCHGQTTSGDGLFVEVGRKDAQHLFLLVDVCGKSDPAAQLVALLEHHLLPDPVCENLRPAELLTLLNGMLQQAFAATGRFVAALALLANGQSGTVTGGNAGQPAPHIGQPGGNWQAWGLPGGAPLGILIPGGGYQEAVAPLTAGQYLLAFTDGVSEAGASKGKMFQFQHGPLQAFLAGLPAGLTADQIVLRLVSALQAHVGGNWPEDDTTILCLQRV